MKINEILLEKLLSKLSKIFVLILEQTKKIPKFKKIKFPPWGIKPLTPGLPQHIFLAAFTQIILFVPLLCKVSITLMYIHT